MYRDWRHHSKLLNYTWIIIHYCNIFPISTYLLILHSIGLTHFWFPLLPYPQIYILCASACPKWFLHELNYMTIDYLIDIIISQVRSGRTLPGFIVFFGSIASFTARMRSSSALDLQILIAATFCWPIPCSAEMLPVQPIKFLICAIRVEYLYYCQ